MSNIRNSGAASKLLITGAGGFLGYNLARRAFDCAWHATLVVHSSPARVWAERVRSCDLTDPAQLRSCLDESAPEVIIHCAALTNVDYCETHPEEAKRINTDTPARLAEWAASHGAYLLHVSTDSVFDGERGNYREDDVPAPLNVYASTKLDAESAVLQCINALVARVNFIGWNPQDKLSLAEWILRALLLREPIRTFADIRFNPLLADDLAGVLLELAARRVTGLLHVAARDSCSKHELALILAEAFVLETGNLQPGPSDEFPLVAARPKDTSLDVERLTRELGRSLPSVREAVAGFKHELDSGAVAGMKRVLPVWLCQAVRDLDGQSYHDYLLDARSAGALW